MSVDEGELMVDESKSKLGMSKLSTLSFAMVDIVLAIFADGICSVQNLFCERMFYYLFFMIKRDFQHVKY